MEALTTLPGLPASLVGFEKGVEEKKQAIQKIRYSHDAMIDMIVANPWVSQGELASAFGYTEGWVSQIIASDAFQARLAQRKNELIDPTLRATIEERFRGLVVRSLEVLMRKLDKKDISDETALRAAEIAAKALGYGPQKAQVTLNQQFVVAVPSKSADTGAWLREHGAGGQGGARPSEVVTVLQSSEPHSALVASIPAAPVVQSGAELLLELKKGSNGNG